MTNSFFTICSLLAIVLASSGKWASAQNCRCASNFCCSKFSFCGTGDDFCGEGCQAGPCHPVRTNPTRVSDVVTDAFFNGIINQAPSNCPGKSFYSRNVFLQAVGLFPRFGTEGSPDDSKREIAAFFAHVTHETGHMCHIEESDKSINYCNPDYQDYQCVPGKAYFGRGPLQLSWNYNYGPAGKALGFDGLNNPEIVSRNPLMSFKAALWYWRTFGHDHIVNGRGFGPTIRAMNGEHECNGRNPGAVNSRINYYKTYCKNFGVDPGVNLQC